MEIIPCSPEMSTDRMYCESTAEVIFAPDYDELNENAEALIAFWHEGSYERPIIKDTKLNAAWEQYFKSWDKSMNELDKWHAVDNFLSYYHNSEWKVFECTFEGMACGPVFTTIFYVVKSDTLIEIDRQWEDNESEENNL